MKKLFLFIAVVTFSMANTFAQIESTTETEVLTTTRVETTEQTVTPIETPSDTFDLRNKLMFGIKAGANLSNVYDTEGEDFESDAKFGFVGGIYLSIPIGPFLGLQPEVLFSQKGFSATGSLLGNSYGLTRTLNFIDVPILIQLKPSPFLTILAGPQYSYLLSKTDKFNTGAITTEQRDEFDNDNLRKNIFCFLGGFDINIMQTSLGARVGWDIMRNNGDGTSTTPRYKNMWVQGTLGFRF